MFSIRSSERRSEFLRNQLFVCYQHFRKGFFNICAAIWMFDLCLIYLINGALPELISDKIGDGAGLLVFS